MRAQSASALANIRQHASMHASFAVSAGTLSAHTGIVMLVEFVSIVDAARHQLNRFGVVGSIAFRLFCRAT
jgi:hypothetical protein